MTLNEIRSRGYWIVGCRLSVARHIFRCVTCRCLRASPVEQKMSDLPGDRVESSPPFTFCGVDLFGPFLIREGRKELKRWGCIFTCLSSRAVHLEVVNSLSTSSFINALRRFVSIRVLFHCLGVIKALILSVRIMSSKRASRKLLLVPNLKLFFYKTTVCLSSR